MYRCAFCHSIVKDGAFIVLRESKYWIGHMCGCSEKTGEELSEIMYYKGLSKTELKALKREYLELAYNQYTDYNDRNRLLASIHVLDTVFEME
ncbi:hypothetical protein J2S13_001677 [Oikeobacillus pervagus]|uniref:Uncharacterized protein n=1 Tax=Oikeobacillus pervagus TaxID=1325931 RepID=A0AAJ1T161_9BACI|nr:hypothetical protein [Oikeobacillus pervagus]MDQ0215277.1 hypothetical protein [Oikeobacillus pervagus]